MTTTFRDRADRHLSLIEALETVIQSTFPDRLGVLDINECAKKVACLQKEFRGHAQVASGRLNALLCDIDLWQRGVSRGEVPYDPEEEAGYKQALFAWISLANILWEKFETYRGQGILLTKPEKIGILLGHKRGVEKSLKNWTAPVISMKNRTPPAISIGETAGQIDELLEAMKNGVKLQRSDELHDLAARAVQLNEKGKLSVEDWVAGLSNDFAAIDD